MFLLDSCTMLLMTGTGWKQLATQVIARRTALGMTTSKAFAERAQLTPRVIGDLENARRSNYSPGTLSQIENALSWRPGSVYAVLNGGSPTLDSPELRERSRKFHETRKQLEHIYDDLQRDPAHQEKLAAAAQQVADASTTPLTTRAVFIAADGDARIARVLEMVAGGQLDETGVADARTLLEDSSIARHSDIFGALSRASKIQIAQLAEQLLEQEQAATLHNQGAQDAVEVTQEPAASTEDEDQKINDVDATAEDQGLVIDPSDERQSDYDLAGGGDRDPGKPSRGRQSRGAQDTEGEAPDEDGPEGGA